MHTLRSIFLICTAALGTTAFVTSCGSSQENTRADSDTNISATTASAEGRPAASEANPPAKKVDTHEGFVAYEQAVKQARAENKIIMIDMYTTWCGWCKRMDRDVYPDERVKAEMAKYFKAVKMNAEAATVLTFDGKLLTEQQVAKLLGVRSFPTTVFLGADEKVIEALPGYVKPEEFALVLRYIGTGANRTVNFEEWKKTATL